MNRRRGALPRAHSSRQPKQNALPLCRNHPSNRRSLISAMFFRIIATIAVASAASTELPPPRPTPFKYPNDPRLRTPAIAYLRSMTYYENLKNEAKTGLRHPRQLSLENIEYLGGPVLRCRCVRVRRLSTVARANWLRTRFRIRAPCPGTGPRCTTSPTETSSLTSVRSFPIWDKISAVRTGSESAFLPFATKIHETVTPLPRRAPCARSNIQTTYYDTDGRCTLVSEIYGRRERGTPGVDVDPARPPPRHH